VVIEAIARSEQSIEKTSEKENIKKHKSSNNTLTDQHQNLGTRIKLKIIMIILDLLNWK